MPYFIYRITPDPLTLEYLDTKEKYQEARSLVRDLRAREATQDPGTIRMIFAKTTGEAEKLLSQPRDDRIIGED